MIVLVNKGKNCTTPGAEQQVFAELTLHIVSIPSLNTASFLRLLCSIIGTMVCCLLQNTTWPVIISHAPKEPNKGKEKHC
jgi:hypothetical protein